MPKATQKHTTNRRDPIFAVISAHVAEMAELDRQVALAEADATDLNAGNMFLAAQVVVETAPTTPAGLRALSDHLREYFAFGSGFALCIGRPFGSGSASALSVNRFDCNDERYLPFCRINR